MQKFNPGKKQKITKIRKGVTYAKTCEKTGHCIQITDPKIGEEYFIFPNVSGG